MQALGLNWQLYAAFVNVILQFGLSFFFLECQVLSDLLKDGVVCLALFFESFDFRGEFNDFLVRTVEF